MHVCKYPALFPFVVERDLPPPSFFFCVTDLLKKKKKKKKIKIIKIKNKINIINK